MDHSPASPRQAALPSAPRIIAFSSIAGAMTVFGQTAGISVFIDSLIADVSVPRAEISTVYSASSLVAALLVQVARHPVLDLRLEQRDLADVVAGHVDRGDHSVHDARDRRIILVAMDEAAGHDLGRPLIRREGDEVVVIGVEAPSDFRSRPGIPSVEAARG